MSSLSLVLGNKNYSSWSLRAWLYLAVNDIPFDEIFLPLDTPEFQSEIGQYSGTRCVPVLIDDGIKISDSLAIVEYLNRHFPTSVGWPAERNLEALALSAVAEMHSGFNALRANYPMNCRQKPFKAPLLGNVERDLGRLDELWQSLMDASDNQGPGLLGALSIVDVFFAPVVFRCHVYQFDLSERSTQYIKEMLDLPAMRAWAEAAEQEKEVIDGDEFHVIHA